MKTEVFEQLKQAMRDKDALKKGVLTLLKAGLDAAEKEKGSALTDLESNAVVQRELKQTKQALDGAVKADRPDLIEKEERKIELLEGFLLDQVNEQQAKQILLDAGVDYGLTMGDAMKIAKAELTGRLDNTLIAKLVKELI